MFKLNRLSKARMEEAARRWGTKGPDVEDLLPADPGIYQPRKLVCYEVHAARLDKLVDKALQQIKSANEYVNAMYDGAPQGGKFSGKMRWLMCLQALRFATNTSANQGVANNAYKNTIEFTDKIEDLVAELYADFERKRSENWAASARVGNDILTAKRIAATTAIEPFIGRLLKSCPTRGGGVWDALLALCMGGKVHDARIPHLELKVRAILTGRINITDDNSLSIISEGQSWIHCPADVARRLQEVIGKDEFGQIEASMYGYWGHAYRESDLANRHGFHRSHPNPRLAYNFNGFKL